MSPIKSAAPASVSASSGPLTIPSLDGKNQSFIVVRDEDEGEDDESEIYEGEEEEDSFHVEAASHEQEVEF